MLGSLSLSNIRLEGLRNLQKSRDLKFFVKEKKLGPFLGVGIPVLPGVLRQKQREIQRKLEKRGNAKKKRAERAEIRAKIKKRAKFCRLSSTACTFYQLAPMRTISKVLLRSRSRKEVGRKFNPGVVLTRET